MKGKQLQSVTASQPISRQFQIKFKLPTCPIFMTQIESESSYWEKRSQIRCGTQRIRPAGWQQAPAFYSLNWCDRKCQSTLINKARCEWNVETSSGGLFPSCHHGLSRQRQIQIYSNVFFHGFILMEQQTRDKSILCHLKETAVNWMSHANEKKNKNRFALVWKEVLGKTMQERAAAAEIRRISKSN